MRGKVSKYAAKPADYRITPAYAGKRWTVETYLDANKDHPRVCGEKHVHLMIAVNSRGSPPRMRGKAPCLDPVREALGITPAYAGKSNVVV